MTIAGFNSVWDAIISTDESFNWLLNTASGCLDYCAGFILLGTGFFTLATGWLCLITVGLLFGGFNRVLVCYSGWPGTRSFLFALTAVLMVGTYLIGCGTILDALSSCKVDVITMTNLVVNGVEKKSIGHPCCLPRIKAILVFISMLWDCRI